MPDFEPNFNVYDLKGPPVIEIQQAPRNSLFSLWR